MTTTKTEYIIDKDEDEDGNENDEKNSKKNNAVIKEEEEVEIITKETVMAETEKRFANQRCNLCMSKFECWTTAPCCTCARCSQRRPSSPRAVAGCWSGCSSQARSTLNWTSIPCSGTSASSPCLRCWTGITCKNCPATTLPNSYQQQADQHQQQKHVNEDDDNQHFRSLLSGCCGRGGVGIQVWWLSRKPPAETKTTSNQKL